MRIALFIPCYVDQFYPNVAIATLQLLEKLGCKVHYPMDQTCCGQPLANSGMEKEAQKTYQHFIRTFEGFDYIVAPSASCAYHVRHHYDIIEQAEEVQHLRKNTLDLTEFLLDVLNIESLDARFPYKVGLHRSCHGLRGLRLAKSSERVDPSFSKWEKLLQMVKDLELITLDRQDECCGFGGTFAVNEAAVSAKMGKDRIADHHNNGAQIITSGDMSCLMHLGGLLERQKSEIKAIHLSEILNSAII